MSARNRGVKSVPSEFFPTPPWPVHRLVEARPRIANPRGRWLEPAFGNGAIVLALGADRDWDVCDLVTTGEDYLTRAHQEYGVGITNPPFTLMQAFAEKMIVECTDVFLLGRLNFLEGRERHAFWMNNTADVYRLPDRPCFAHKLTCGTKGCKGALIPWTAETPETCPCACWSTPHPVATRKPGQDATGYAWFHWGPEVEGRIYFLEPTPKSERVDRVIPARADTCPT